MNRSVLAFSMIAGVAIATLAAAPASLAAQQATYRGSVRSSTGEPIAGASVYLGEISAQSATGENGQYILIVPGDRVRGQQIQLRVRAIGFRPSSRMVTITAGEHSVDFTLAADINRLEEIVVTGVMEGTEQARVPFAVASVDMADVPVQSVDPLRLLAGRVPGANVTSGSGRPGAQAAVILRGPTSINAAGRGQGPLYIVDGVIINGNLPDLNPADIENIEVVKGAAASSLYGARAGNGVIQITTRSGRRAADGMSFNVRGEYGQNDIEGSFPLARQTSLLSDAANQRFCVNVTGQSLCSRTVDWNAEAARINNQPGDAALTPVSFPLDPGAGASGAPLRNSYQAQLWPGRTFDAVEQAVNPQGFGQLQVDGTGRFGQTQVYSSFGMLDQAGAIRFLEGFQRYSARLNVDQRLTDDMQMSLRSFYSRSTADGLDQEGGGTAFFRLTRVPAIANVLARDTLGRIYVRPNLQLQGSQNENPLQSLENQADVAKTDRFIGGLTLRYAPAPWVDLEANGSYDLQNYGQDFFRNKGYRTTGPNPATNNGLIRLYNSRDQSYNASLNASFRRRFGNNIQTRWSLRGLFERQDFNERQGQGNQLGAVGVPQLNNATAGQTITSSESSVRQVGLFAGVNVDLFDGRYIVEGLIRRDGTSLFGSENRWATFGRGSVAWRPSQESWWFGGNALNDLKLRYSRGSAGGRPRFNAQYETFNVTTTGPTLNNQGNKTLRPEVTIDNEFGADFELFRRFGVQITRALSETRDQLLQVPLPAEKGFGTQWQNAGTLENRTWELAVNLPVISRRNVNWSWRFTYDQTRTYITELNVAPFSIGTNLQGTNAMFRIQEGERFGTFYGRAFARSCSQLPAAFQNDCGVDGVSSYQFNDEGYLVWVGAGNSPRDGITRNLWQTALSPSAATPWGVGFNWGMPIVIRDTSCVTTPNPSCPPQAMALGNALPDWQFSLSSNLQFGRFTVFGLMQGVMGREVWNQGRHWSHLDFITSATDQRNRSVEVAKPIGYYWRAPIIDGFSGLGGFYDVLAQNSHFVEDASYMKLRELMVAYNAGPIGGVGNWTISLVGRNLFTITDYQGFDPEVGIGGNVGSTASSAAINAVDAFTFPNTRAFTIALSTSF